MSDRKLFTEFQEVSAKQWKQKIQVDLKGADYNKTLVWESPEGLHVKPFYHPDEINTGSQQLKTTDHWRIGHPIYVDNAEWANRKALEMLKKGAECLFFFIPSEAIKMETLLQGIAIEKVRIYLNMGFLSPSFHQNVLDFFKHSPQNIFFNIDPVGQLAKTGNWFDSWENDFQIARDKLTGNTEHLLGVNMALYQNAGANMVQQLGYALAHAQEYLNAFANVPKSITFAVSLGSNYFFEMAKLRALRWLWHSVTEAFDLSISCHVIAYPSKRNKTLYDYNTNMLRTTTECMAAVLGGADMIMNLPYDSLYLKSNAFSDRIALNQLLVLKNESHFDKVQHVTQGAYYIESLTDQMAEKALALFKSIEKGGGFLKQLKAGTLQRKIRESDQKEQREFENGNLVLVGTNKYRNDQDTMKETIALYPFLKRSPRKTWVEPILERRLAEEVEKKRLNDE